VPSPERTPAIAGMSDCNSSAATNQHDSALREIRRVNMGQNFIMQTMTHSHDARSSPARQRDTACLISGLSGRDPDNLLSNGCGGLRDFFWQPMHEPAR
jgi:hypothetical protein